MGWKYEVFAWSKMSYGYADVQVHAGNSLVRAVLAAIKAKRSSGCVTLVWR